MPSKKDLIKEKLRRLETVPDAFINSLSSVEKKYFAEVIKLLSSLELVDGNFVLNEKNVAALAEIESKLKPLFLKTDYVKNVKTFIDEIQTQANITDSYFKDEFTKVASEVIDEAGLLNLQLIKKDAATQLLGKPVDVKFIDAISQTVNDAVLSNATYSETLDSLQNLIVGNAEIDSKISQYAKQITHDLFAVGDRQYTQSISEELNAQWFFWSGGIIKTSRAFCIERHNLYYHKKEIEKWGAGQKTVGLELPFADGNWDGKMAGTNAATIFAYAGGWGCLHSVLPVSVFSVPKDVIERVIAEGFYKPSEEELALLEL